MPRVDDHQLRREHFETFHIWFKEHVQTLRRTTDVILSEELILLANGPHNLARRFNGRKDKNPRLGSVYYYGQLTDIVEIRYSNEKKHVPVTTRLASRGEDPYMSQQLEENIMLRDEETLRLLHSPHQVMLVLHRPRLGVVEDVPRALKSGVLLTTQLGIIVRNGNIVPLTFVDWNSVPDDIVDAIWKDVKDNLNICPEEYKPICMKNCNSIWKDHKNKLKAKYFKPRSSDPNLKDDVPMNVVPSQWEQLVEYWRTSDAEKIASRNAKNRRAHGIAHTTGRTTFSQIRHEMTSKGESTDKMNVWLMTRRVDDPEDEFNRQLSMLPEDGRTLEARNAIFHELIGHDRHGYCRTYGRIVPRRVVYKDGAGPSQSTPHPSTIDQITQQVRAELRDELREELRAEFSTHLQQMRAEMMALVSQGASVDPNRQVPDASSGHRAFRESAEDENPYTPPPEDQIFPE
ncbi:hypothetical protein CsSME_00015158 [Camellia sinensis var. sinensis]